MRVSLPRCPLVWIHRREGPMWSRKVMDHSANPQVSDSLLSVTLAEEAELARTAPAGYPQGLSLVLAVVMHALVIGAGLIHLPEAESVEAPEAIPVEIVQLPKEEPEPEPEPESQPEPEPEPQAEPEQRPEKMPTARSSGASDNPDLKADEAPRAETEAEPKGPEPKEETTDSAELPPDMTFGLSSYDEIMEAMDRTAYAIRSTGSKENSGRGQGGGDPYLNAMRDRITARIVYPGAGGRAGTAFYRAVITRGGRLARVELLRSTGVAALDQAGLDAIRASAPFNPLPRYIPGDSAVIDIALRVAP